MARDFEWLQDETSKWLNFNPLQANQDFTTQQIKDAVNDAYIDEVNTAKLQCNINNFKMTLDFTWAADAVTISPPVFPAQLNRTSVYKMTDVTDNDPGYDLIFDRDGRTGDVTWKDYQTLQWGDSGPSSDKTIRAFYLADAVEMDADEDEPILVPSSYRRLIVLSAAVSLRDMADEGAPQAWLMRLQNYRMDFWKFIKLGRPISDVPTIVNDHADVDVGYVF